MQAVASRVAEEMNVKLGEEVGYTIRFEDHANAVIIILQISMITAILLLNFFCLAEAHISTPMTMVALIYHTNMETAVLKN